MHHLFTVRKKPEKSERSNRGEKTIRILFDESEERYSDLVSDALAYRAIGLLILRKLTYSKISKNGKKTGKCIFIGQIIC